jgi:hypothetical protein
MTGNNHLARGYLFRGLQYPLAVFAVIASLALPTGCGGGGSNSTLPPAASAAAPAIKVQPASQSVPMGLAATYAVTAVGAALQYQWYRDGALIPGANGNTYVTPTTQFSDTGASFTVVVSNTGGSVTSSAASLTVSARAPRSGDLRFQQVDASWIVSGYGNSGVALSSGLNGRMAMTFSPSSGTPLYAGPGDCSPPPVEPGVGCFWDYSEVPLQQGPSAGYGADFYTSFEQDLQTGIFASIAGVTPASPNSVITSLDLEPAANLFALSWVQNAAAGVGVDAAFDTALHTVAVADLQAAATAEGASSRVITALSHDSGGITYLSYGWQADQTTLYEAQAVTATAAGAPAAAAALAAQGYIITATGLVNDQGDVVLVGTRVQGDTMPRAFIAAQGSAQIQSMQQQGYAAVGVIMNLAQQADPYTYLGER